MPSIYSLQQNLVVNSNFTSGSSTGWTYSEDDSSGIATSNFNVSGGDYDLGLWYLKATETGFIKTSVYNKGKQTDVGQEIEVELTKNDETDTQGQDFTWGVLAINTHKSIYLENETAFIGIAVLDDNGHMVCDADVALGIIDPNDKKTILSTENGLIKISPECSVYSVTDLPDYYTDYTVNSAGTYMLNLTAVTSNGVRTITDEITVQNSVDFDVARDGPTRIYPPVPYVMNFTIKANINYTGLIKEYVHASFKVTPQQGLTITTAGDTKELTWNKNLVKGETYNIYYGFDAPDISPYLYALGKLHIGDWQEARHWYLAADSIMITQYAISYTDTPDLDGAIDVSALHQADTTTIDTANNLDGGTWVVVADYANETIPAGSTVNVVNATFVWGTDGSLTDEVGSWARLWIGDNETGTPVWYLLEEWNSTNTAPSTYTTYYYDTLANGTSIKDMISTAEKASKMALNFTAYESTDKNVDIQLDQLIINVTYIDEVSPQITVVSPENRTYNTSSVWFNVTLNEDGDWCGYSLDGAANVTMSNTSTTDWYLLAESLSDSSHNITYSCNDTSGNMNSSAVTIYFTVDTTYPQYSLNQTNSTEAGADTLFSLYWTDNIALAGYIFSFDNGTGTFVNNTYTEMTGIGNWSNTSKRINSTVGALIRWRVYTNDTAGNMNVSKIYSFNTVDSIFPKITIESPLNRSYNSTSVWANLTLNEDGGWCGYSLDGAANVTMSNTSTIDWYLLVESLSESSHNITYSCNDTSGNMNSSEVTEYFTVDITLPTIYIYSPDNITYSSNPIDLNVSADEDIDTWLYSLNGNSNVTFDPNTTITATEGINNITVYANDTAGNLNSTTVYFSFNTTLEVVLEEPSTSFKTGIIQNTTFIVNATVICRQGSCGDVSATVRYNKTSANPETAVNITQGAEPFFIDEASPLSTKSCPTNPLSENEYCNITWTLNATDSGLDVWKLDVNFSSNSGWTTKNVTLSSEIEVTSCTVDLTVTWSAIDFNDPLTPNTYENPALGNDNNLYNITINDGSCNTDLYIKGTDMENDSAGYVLGVGNLTWNNVSDSYATSYNMTDTYAPLKIDMPPLTNVTTWYWINVPPIFAADYNGTVFIQGVMNGNPQP